MAYESQITDDDNVEDVSGMKTACLGNMVIIIHTRGAIRMAKSAYPARYGVYGEIRTKEYSFHFNPTGEIRYIRGLTQAWPHPWEWLKRTWGNDWIYYSAGLDRGQGRVSDWMGENYIPCLSYESNAIRDRSPYTMPDVAVAFSAWSQVYGTLCTSSLDSLDEDIRNFIKRVIQKNEDNALIEQTKGLHSIIGGRISVLPPDTRHVDYEVIPLNVSDGCLYRCAFCSVKSGQRFSIRTHDDIVKQIDALKSFYGINLQNINGLFIGNHDALAAGMDTISFAANKAYTAFGYENHAGGTPSLFLFGSAGAFLKSDHKAFETLHALPYKSYINIGLESFDSATLNQLGKPITPQMVEDALKKMIDVNNTYTQVEVTANFLLGTPFSDAHRDALVSLLGNLPETTGSRGCVYLSPLIEILHREEVLPMFHTIKKTSRLPVYIYLIQRL